ncbi:peroxisomal targeting signal 1 receptor isoform X2 [Agrilus planipennis]|uniref:Peroxisomal targeting signal 1 receptor isoform X2 n=1 Tax=Agrilus planipennis TaxID=224129 RepID=A0A7F5RK33_AGRPL|nr:peroxisomal targeting signal 1 receptor isoform X2 [Agrilus planipennis]
MFKIQFVTVSSNNFIILVVNNQKMAWRKLAEGDCGDDNALMKFAGHFTKDHTFSEAHSSVVINHNQTDNLVQEFLQETRALPQSYRMSDLMKEMQEIESQRLTVPPIPASKVKDQLSDNIWADEYSQVTDDRPHNTLELDHGLIWAEISKREQNDISSSDNAYSISETEVINKDVYNADAFKHIFNKDEGDQDYAQFMDFLKKVNLEQGSHSTILNKDDVKDESDTWTSEYINDKASTLNKTWNVEKGLNAEKGDDYYNTFWDKLQNEWKKLAEEVGDNHPWLDDIDELTDPYKEYEFAEDNPMLKESNPFETGKKMLAIGDFPSAVLCFEAAVQKNPDNADAWLYLGTTQAENEQDSYAISALKRCIQLQPDNLMAHMSLSVSYANENYHNQACRELIAWLQNNPNYSDLVPSDLQISGMHHRYVQQLFIKAAQRQPVNPDYEVQCGLGILFNLSGEYSKAVDCFRVALSTRPDDARLWNRLGATLANGNRPEEAVEAYHRALTISPGFIRARYNVGITCINLKAYQEAAEHLLIALNQQSRGRNHNGEISSHNSQMSDTIWSTLRLCISLMNRLDLRPVVDSRDLKTLNQNFNIENN